MKKEFKISPKIIFSGGGTGGHIYPAIALANEIKNRLPNAEILFVGAEGKMEMEKVPQAGYPIEGLWISGLQRSAWWKNFNFPFKLVSSLWKARKIIKSFQPHVVVGTGGFASGPIMYVAAQNGIPIVVQEQNSFPGITNKLLKNKAAAICVAYDGMQKHFPAQVLYNTGNPIRAEIFQNLPDSQLAKQKFGLDPQKPVILSVGGSLGSRTLNNAWQNGVQKIIDQDVQLIWQTGKLDYQKIKAQKTLQHPLIHITEFIYEMKEAYAAADIIVSRAGAMAISELSIVGKPTILVPFPYAAEDHQTKNAQSLVDKGAALMVTDAQAPNELVNQALELITNSEAQKQMRSQLKKIGKPQATHDIVEIILQQI